MNLTLVIPNEDVHECTGKDVAHLPLAARLLRHGMSGFTDQCPSAFSLHVTNRSKVHVGHQAV